MNSNKKFSLKVLKSSERALLWKNKDYNGEEFDRWKFSGCDYI